VYITIANGRWLRPWEQSVRAEIQNLILLTSMSGTKSGIMIKSKKSMLIACILLSITACTENKSSEFDKKIEERSPIQTIRIVFSLPGDDIGSPEYRDILDNIIDSIVRSEAGVIVRYGFGMGTMDIVIRTSIEQPTEKLSRIVLSQFPKAKYRIEELKE
jgi:hypothetical protein